VTDTHEHTPSGDTVEGVLRIDAKSRSKRFQGVWLEQGDGTRLLLSYRADGCWTAFEDRAVQANGASYQPGGQSIDAPHFRVDTLSLSSEDPSALYVGLGPEQELKGEFTWATQAPGSKRGGEQWLLFQGDRSYEIANPEKAERFATETSVIVKGRSVTRSPYSAHAAGPVLWVLSVRPDRP
jgi:hypothetical protein